jgi:DNA adenine methylase
MSYLGSKAASGAYQAIIAQMPPHDLYIETHLGTGAVMRHKPAAARSVGIERDAEILRRFQCDYDVELFEQDCIEWLKEFNLYTPGRVLIYADPPYLLSTRTSRKRYKYDYSENDHKKLLGLLCELPAMVMISGYPSSLYDVRLRGWRTLAFQVMTHGGVRTEKLWMNFRSQSVHWAACAGKDFTDRQRIKRKAQRWADNYRRLPAGERAAILEALLNAHADPT